MDYQIDEQSIESLLDYLPVKSVNKTFLSHLETNGMHILGLEVRNSYAYRLWTMDCYRW